MKTICNLIGIDIIFSDKENYRILIPRSNKIMILESHIINDELEMIINFFPLKKSNYIYLVTKQIAEQCVFRDDFYVIQDYEKKYTHILAYSIIRNPFFRDYYEKEKQNENKIITQDCVNEDDSNILPDFSRKYKILTQLKDFVEYKKIL